MSNPFVTRSVTAPNVFAINSLPNCVQLVERISPDKVKQLHRTLGKYLYAWQCVIPCLIAQANGARIGEILSLQWVDLCANGMAIIKGEKKSGSRLINTFLPAELVWDMQLKASTVRVFPFGYQKVYHFARMAGLGENIVGRKNKAVTHAGRYHLADKAAKLLGKKSAKEILGHKSERSTEHYISEERLGKILLQKTKQPNNNKQPKWEV